MNEQELRALVRAAITQHAGSGGLHPPQPSGRISASHASHGLFVLPAGADSDGPCIIEPAVPCNHCGYCKSLGH